MKAVRRAKVDYYDALELAALLVGREIETDDDLTDTEQDLYDKFEIDGENFQRLLEHLIPLIMVGQGITEKWYRGFGIDQCFIVKEEVK